MYFSPIVNLFRHSTMGRVQTIVTIESIIFTRQVAPPRWNNTRCVTMGLDARNPDFVACEKQMR